MDISVKNKIVQNIKFLFGKFIAKYSFVDIYYDMNDNNDCILVSVDYNSKIDYNDSFWNELFETKELLSNIYINQILFTTNEELFILTDNKEKVEPFNTDDMTLKEKINEIIKLIDSIKEEYKVEQGILVTNIIHPRSFTQEQVLELCEVNYDKSDYDGTYTIQILYTDDEGYRNTFFNEYNSSMVADKSADSLINALNMAKINYHKTNDVVYRAIMNNGNTDLDMAIFQQLFIKYLG